MKISTTDFAGCEGFQTTARGTSLDARGPSSGSLQGRNPRDVWRRRCSGRYGDLMSGVGLVGMSGRLARRCGQPSTVAKRDDSQV